MPPASSPRVTVRVIEREGPRHERENYSSLPFNRLRRWISEQLHLDAAPLLRLRGDDRHEMSPEGQTKGARERGGGGAPCSTRLLRGEDSAVVREQAASEGVLQCLILHLWQNTAKKKVRLPWRSTWIRGTRRSRTRRSCYLIWPCWTSGALKGTERRVMTEESGLCMGAQKPRGHRHEPLWWVKWSAIIWEAVFSCF